MQPEVAGWMDSAPAFTSSEQPVATPRSNKRKRDSDSTRTSYRPKTAKTGKKNILKEQHEPGDRWSYEPGNNAPVPLPSHVVDLFSRPYQFPKPHYDELLKNYGVRPQVFYKTATNGSCFADHLDCTPDVISRKIRATVKRMTVDEELKMEQPRDGSFTAEKVPRFQARSDGLFTVRMGHRLIEFQQAQVSLLRLDEETEARLMGRDVTDSE